mgnify:CR=1 FL=1
MKAVFEPSSSPSSTSREKKKKKGWGTAAHSASKQTNGIAGQVNEAWSKPFHTYKQCHLCVIHSPAACWPSLEARSRPSHTQTSPPTGNLLLYMLHSPAACWPSLGAWSRPSHTQASPTGNLPLYMIHSPAACWPSRGAWSKPSRGRRWCLLPEDHPASRLQRIHETNDSIIFHFTSS